MVDGLVQHIDAVVGICNIFVHFVIITVLSMLLKQLDCLRIAAQVVKSS